MKIDKTEKRISDNIEIYESYRNGNILDFEIKIKSMNKSKITYFYKDMYYYLIDIDLFQSLLNKLISIINK